MRLKRSSQRGVSLIEVMVSMAIFAIGLLGLLRMHVISSGANGYAHHMVRATAVAQDLLAYLQQIDARHSLLSNAQTGNDTDLLDEAGVFTGATVASTAYDHIATELPTAESCETVSGKTVCAPPFRGLVADRATGDTSTPTLDFSENASGNPQFERYWLVAPMNVQGAAGEPVRQATGIAAVVRWRDASSGTFRRVVALGTRYDLDAVTQP